MFKAQRFQSLPFHLFFLLLFWKIVDFLISFFAPYFIPYLGFFSYGVTMFQYGVPDFVRDLTNFDGIFYINIGIHGYKLTEQAYFPFYPILLYNLNTVVHNPIFAGLLISIISFTIGIVLFYYYLSFLIKKKDISWTLLFLLAYPTSYYFGVLYTESLFFLLVVGTLLCLVKKYYWASMVFAFCASLTRVVGVLLLLPIGVAFLKEILAKPHNSFKDLFFAVLKQWQIFGVGVASLLGLLTYSFYLWTTVKDPLYFVHAQESFGAHRSSRLITPFQVIYRYIHIFVAANKNFQYWVAVAELSFYVTVMSLLLFEFVKLWKQYQKKKKIHFERLGLALFSLTSLIVPSLTGTLTAVPRYTLMSLSMYLVLAEISHQKFKIALLLFFFLIHICYFALFIQGYYVT